MRSKRKLKNAVSQYVLSDGFSTLKNNIKGSLYAHIIYRQVMLDIDVDDSIKYSVYYNIRFFLIAKVHELFKRRFLQ